MKDQNESPEKKFKGVWIPWQIWEDEHLTWTMRCLWANISGLGRNKQDPCTASNEWLADRMQTSPGVINNLLSKMRALGYIEDVGFDGRRRAILAVTPSEKMPSTECKQLTPTDAPCLHSQVNSEQAPNKKGKNKEKEIRKEGVTPVMPEELNHPIFLKEWEQWVPERRAKGGRIKDWGRLFQRQLDDLKPLGPEAAAACIHKSLLNGWTGIFPEKRRPAVRHVPESNMIQEDIKVPILQV